MHGRIAHVGTGAAIALIAVVASSTPVGAQVGPVGVAEVELDVATRSITFDPQLGTFAFQAPVASFTRTDGTVVSNPMVDPLVGSIVQFAGTYTGSDFLSMSDVDLNANITITQLFGTSVVATVVINRTLQPQGIASEFGAGPLGTYPLWHRQQTSPIGAPPMAVGTPSPMLLDFAARITANGLSARTALRLADPPAIRKLYAAFAPPAPRFAARVASTGNGDLYLGVINITENEIYNIFSDVVANPTGSGFYLGLIPSDLFAAIVQAPLGLVPFHVLPDYLGTYCYSVPPGTLPSGLVLDYVCAQFTSGSEVEGSSPMQVVL